MKVRSITLLLLSLLFIPSKGKWETIEKLSGKGVYRPLNNGDIAAKCTDCPKPTPLKWVTYGEWGELPGGRSRNPAVKMDGAPDRDECEAFGQVKRDGCWQTGCLASDPTGSYWKALMVAWDGGHHFGYNPLTSGARILVNPGGSASYKWVDWDSGKGSFPDTTVYGDHNCALAVATYYDSSSVWAYKRRQGAQADKDGYVYWQDKTVGGSWQWDNNEYGLLTVNTVRKAFIKDFDVLEETKTCDEKEKKPDIRDITTVENNSTLTLQETFKLEFTDQTSSYYDHSISWNFGTNVQVEVGVGAIGLTAGYSLNLGGEHGWGGSNSQEMKITRERTLEVPPKTRFKIQMTGIQTTCSFDYIATVELTYSNGYTNTVKDYGKFEGVDFNNYLIKTDSDDID